MINASQSRFPIRNPWLGYGFAVGTVALALLCTLAIRPLLGQTIFALFFIAIIASAWYASLSAGLLALALSVIASDYFLLDPVGQHSLSLSDLTQLGIAALIALLICLMTAARRRAEGELHDQRERFATTLASIGDAVIATDAQGRVTFMNGSAEALTGWPQATASGEAIDKVFEIVNADTRQPVESPVARVLREGQVVGLANHTLLLARDGNEWPIDDSGAPIRDAGGNIVGVVMVFRDISERSQAEALLARYQLLFGHARDIILFIRADGRIMEANRAAAAYGFSREELLAMRIHDLRDPATLPDVAERMAHADAEGILFETRHRRKDGSTFPVEVSSRGATIGGARVLLSIIRDISARQKAAEAQSFLAEAGRVLADATDYQARLDAVARLAVPRIADWCAIDLLGEDGTFAGVKVAHADPSKVAWARELRRRYPIDPDAPSGVAHVVRTGTTEFYPEITDAMLQATLRSPQQLEIARTIGFSSVVIAPLIARGRTLGAITLVAAESRRRYDRADVELAEELARRAAIAIENAQLYAAERQARATAEAAVHLRDQFLSIAAHELKTPLTSLLGNVQLMQRRALRDGMLPERELRSLRLINQQSVRLQRMVLALLDISRLDSGQLSIERAPLDLGALVRRVVEEIRPTLTSRAIELLNTDEPLIISGDELRLEQVLQNLIQNAIKYSLDNQTIDVRVERSGACVCVAIMDRGIGIPQAALPQLFQRFYRAPNVEDQHISGMGVGLYVVKEIVGLHGGEITVQSTEGQGSTFTVCLPLLDP